MNVKALSGVGLALALALAACGSPAPTSSGQAAAQAGTSYYLASNASTVELITWDQAGAGTVTYDSIDNSGSDPSAPYSLSTQTTNVEVSVNGSAVTISVPLGGTIDGTINSDGNLTVTGPPDASTGQIESGTLQPSNPTAYNNALNALNATISQDNQLAAAVQQSQATASANSAAEQTAQSDMSAVQGIGFSNDLGSLSTDVGTIQNDLQTEKNDIAQGPGSDCYGVSGTVDYDVTGTIDYDVTGTFQYDLNTLTTDISSARSAITTFKGDLSSLGSSGLAAPSGASAAIASAQQAISQAVSTANGDIDTENSVQDTAYSLANAMATGACAGDGPGSPPTPMSHIS